MVIVAPQVVEVLVVVQPQQQRPPPPPPVRFWCAFSPTISRFRMRSLTRTSVATASSLRHGLTLRGSSGPLPLLLRLLPPTTCEVEFRSHSAQFPVIFRSNVRSQDFWEFAFRNSPQGRINVVQHSINIVRSNPSHISIKFLSNGSPVRFLSNSSQRISAIHCVWELFCSIINPARFLNNNSVVHSWNQRDFSESTHNYLWINEFGDIRVFRNF